MNPVTKLPFKFGDLREDGKIFKQYNCTRVKQDGFFVESWVGAKKYIKTEYVRKAKYKKTSELTQANRRQHHSENRNYKFGDQHPDKNLFFAGYDRTRLDKDGFAREKWYSAENFAQAKKLGAKQTAKTIGRYQLKHAETNPPRRLNPETGKLFKKGDKRANDDRVFYAYTVTAPFVDDIYHGERWLKPETFWKQNFFRMHSLLKRRARKKDLRYNLSKDYLLEIFPLDSLCPVFGIKMEFGGDKRLSPSLDRFVPSLGYIKGNVAWISGKANSMKSDATFEELSLLLKWMKSRI